MRAWLGRDYPGKHKCSDPTRVVAVAYTRWTVSIPASEGSPQHVKGLSMARAKKGEAGIVGAAGDRPGLAYHSPHRH